MLVKKTVKALVELGAIGALYVGGTSPEGSQVLLGGALQNLAPTMVADLPKVSLGAGPLEGLTLGGWGAIPLGLSVYLAWRAYDKTIGKATAKVGRVKVTKAEQDAAGAALKAGTISPKQQKYLEQCYRADIKKRMNETRPRMGEYFHPAPGYSYTSFEDMKNTYRYDATKGWEAIVGATPANAAQDIQFLKAMAPDGQVKWTKSFYIKRAIEMRQALLKSGAAFLAPEKKWQRTAGKTTSYVKNLAKVVPNAALTGCSVAMAASIFGAGAPLVMAWIVAFPFMCKGLHGMETTLNLLVNRGIKAPRIR